MTSYNIINDFIYERFQEINKFVIKSNKVFDLINKLDRITLYENNNVVDLQHIY